MINRDVINKLVKDKVRALGGFLVDIRVSNTNQIKIEVDKPDGIHIDECVEISKYIQSKLDRDEEDYALQVSSPGMNEPFKVWEQYQKNVGKNVIVILKDSTTINGKLQDVNKESITVEEKTNKNKETKIHNFLFKDIKQTKKVFSFK